mmetsp:Transcript_4113/g.11583  ORF Transcript_4113/g.11583 Transcript_4113/m.11583 type:complete len:262 (+) Transcript_4113:146-931(+)
MHQLIQNRIVLRPRLQDWIRECEGFLFVVRHLHLSHRRHDVHRRPWTKCWRGADGGNETALLHVRILCEIQTGVLLLVTVKVCGGLPQVLETSSVTILHVALLVAFLGVRGGTPRRVDAHQEDVRMPQSIGIERETTLQTENFALTVCGQRLRLGCRCCQARPHSLGHRWQMWADGSAELLGYVAQDLAHRSQSALQHGCKTLVAVCSSTNQYARQSAHWNLLVFEMQREFAGSETQDVAHSLHCRQEEQQLMTPMGAVSE